MTLKMNIRKLSFFQRLIVDMTRDIAPIVPMNLAALHPGMISRTREYENSKTKQMTDRQMRLYDDLEK